MDCDGKLAATRSKLRALFESIQKFPTYLLKNPPHVYSNDLALISNFLGQNRVPWANSKVSRSCSLCLLLLWKAILGIFNCFSYDLNYKLFASPAAASILSLGCGIPDVGLRSVIDDVNCSRYIDDY